MPSFFFYVFPFRTTPPQKLRGRRILCQEHGPDNEILSHDLKQIRWANSQSDFERLITRFRRLQIPGSGAKEPCSAAGQQSSVVVHSNSYLRPAADYCRRPEVITGYESDAQLLAVIQSSSSPSNGGGVQRGRRWWPNGMSCEEFAEIRRLLFSHGDSVTPWDLKSCHRRNEYKSSEGKKNQHENKHHYEQQHRTKEVNRRSRRTTTQKSSEDGVSDNNEHLNKGFQWRVNFLLKLCTLTRAEQVEKLLVELRSSTTKKQQQQQQPQQQELDEGTIVIVS